jgi:hypothetical protein
MKNLRSRKKLKAAQKRKGANLDTSMEGGEKRSEMKLHAVSVMEYLQNSSSLSELKRLLDSIVDMFMARIF